MSLTSSSSSNSIALVDDDSYVVILANGSFPCSEEARKYFAKSSKLICCDGAAQKACAHDLTPDVIIGDCDSISPELRKQFHDILVHVEEQDTNDLAKAFRYCLSQNWKRIVILGATGEREDHALGNISYLVEFIQQVDDVKLVTDAGYFLPIKSSGTFRCIPGQQISIFSLDPRQRITSQGLKYPLNRLQLPLWYMATLNQALSDSFTLQFDETSPLLLFFANETK